MLDLLKVPSIFLAAYSIFSASITIGKKEYMPYLNSMNYCIRKTRLNITLKLFIFFLLYL